MADHDDFFIGWAGPSRRLLGTLVLVVLVLVGVFAGTAIAITQLQQSPGISERSRETFVGVYRSAPYGHLVVPGVGRNPAQTVLMSRQGKYGLQGKFAQQDGTLVTAKGFTMVRDGRTFLELGSALSAVEPADAELTPAALEALREIAWEDLGEISVTGEIVDSKCYFGRMRPGSGKGHRACAQLCVHGGIPPVLVLTAPDGRRSHAVITGPGRTDAHEAILPFIAEPVQVTGTLWRRGDLFAVEVEIPTGITRLWPRLR